jgi:hypothetical protein
MDKKIFLERARLVCKQAIEFAREFAIQQVPSKYELLVFPNSSCDLKLRPGEVIYPEESLRANTYVGPMAVNDFVDCFWRDHRIPEWIDVSVGSVRDGITLVEILVCGRFTSVDALLYHHATGHPPFNVKSPTLPVGWNPANPERFDINCFRVRCPIRATSR